MSILKRLSGIIFTSLLLLLLLFSVAGEIHAVSPQEQANKQEQKTALESDDQILKLARELRKDKKIEEALALLDKGLKQFPASVKLFGEKYEIYRAEKRYEECLQMLDDKAKDFPEEEQKRIRFAKQLILQPLIQSLLKEGKNDKAFSYFVDLADAGYRGFHQFKHNALYEPLRQRAEFKDIMKKIAENSGLGRPPRDFTVTLTSSDTYTLSSRKGKVVLVDFWSTACLPCIKELPNLRAIYEAHKDKGFEIISISLDENKEKLDAFLANNPMPWNTVFSKKGWKDDTAKLYEVSWIPSLWLVDRKGILRYFDVRDKDLKAAIEELLAE